MANNNCAVEEALRMMGIPTRDLPVLATEFLRHLSSKVGYCSEVCITAYAAYNQMVLKMKCEDSLYAITEEDLEWWADRGYYL